MRTIALMFVVLTCILLAIACGGGHKTPSDAYDDWKRCVLRRAGSGYYTSVEAVHLRCLGYYDDLSEAQRERAKNYLNIMER